jgi:molybdopterin converting factor small subunit
VKLVRMKSGHGDQLLAEGDPEVAEEEERLVAAFRQQLDLGLWAAVPVRPGPGRREAIIVRDFSEVPRDADQVIFFPPASGGAR